MGKNTNVLFQMESSYATIAPKHDYVGVSESAGLQSVRRSKPIQVPVAQWIEHRSPEPGAQVRFLSGTPSEPFLDSTVIGAAEIADELSEEIFRDRGVWLGLSNLIDEKATDDSTQLHEIALTPPRKHEDSNGGWKRILPPRVVSVLILVVVSFLSTISGK